jgi:hypothetical protein
VIIFYLGEGVGAIEERVTRKRNNEIGTMIMM